MIYRVEYNFVYGLFVYFIISCWHGKLSQTFNWRSLDEKPLWHLVLMYLVPQSDYKGVEEIQKTPLTPV